jgi:hypothetical protein
VYFSSNALRETADVIPSEQMVTNQSGILISEPTKQNWTACTRPRLESARGLCGLLFPMAVPSVRQA